MRAVEPWLEHPFCKLGATIAKASDEPPTMALCGAVLVGGLVSGRPRLTRAGARMLLAQGIAVVFKEIGKRSIDRSRPRILFDENRYVRRWGSSHDSDLQSLPSGHSAGAFAVARAAAREYPGAKLPLNAAAAAMSALQPIRRAHFPTDVIAGIAVGIAAEAVSAMFWRRLTRLR